MPELDAKAFYGDPRDPEGKDCGFRNGAGTSMVIKESSTPGP